MQTPINRRTLLFKLVSTEFQNFKDNRLKWIWQRYNIYTMKFEHDSEKSRRNKEKHGIDFSDAQALWRDPDLIEIPALIADEPRFLVVGKIDGKHWSAVITYRDENVRIISVRRSREEEVDIYEG